MSYAAVIFDFYGTLTEPLSKDELREGRARVAALLGVPVETYGAALDKSWPDRAKGKLGDLEESTRWLARECGVDLDGPKLAAVAEERVENQRKLVRIRPDAEPTLHAIKERGKRIGLITDCTDELPRMWPELPVSSHIDAPVFSVVVGLKKPDPAIYLRACADLDVKPSECLYIGDGDSNELAGAEAAGMRATRLVSRGNGDSFTFDTVTWTGATIPTLTAVRELL